MEEMNSTDMQAPMQSGEKEGAVGVSGDQKKESILNAVLTFLNRISIQVRHFLRQAKKYIHDFYISQSRKAKVAILSMMIIALFGVVFLFVINSVKSIGSHKPNTNRAYSINAQKDKLIAEKMQFSNIQAKSTQIIQEKLDAMQSDLSKTTLSSQKLSEIESQMHALSQSIQGMKENSDALRSASLKSELTSRKTQKNTVQQVKNMQLQLSSISKAVVPQHYLPVSDLPFQVVGLDFWNEKPMASIAMKDTNGVMHYRLMGQGMTFDCHGVCRSWTLEKIDTDPNELVFGNQKGQKIKVGL